MFTTAGISFGTFIVGFLLGYLATRRGRKLYIDWHLRINTEEFGRKDKEDDRHSDTDG